MPRYPKKQRPVFTDYSSLPVVLKTCHIVDLMDCCEATAMELFRQWDKKKLLTVVWCGNSPRINRDAFLHYFSGGILSGPNRDKEQKPPQAIGL